jgi:uncharacterized membrane protein YcaP (DUF421 family)
LENIFNLDWGKIFLPDTPLLEIVIRGSIMYLAIFLLMRFILKREAGGVSITDVLLVVLLADAAQNGMAGEYTSIANGILLVATIMFWSFALNWLGYHIPVIGRLVHPPPLLLVKDGKLIRRNMRKEFITEDELMSMLREQGINDLSQAAQVNLEGDGQISVVTVDKEQHSRPDNKAR